MKKKFFSFFRKWIDLYDGQFFHGFRKVPNWWRKSSENFLGSNTFVKKNNHNLTSPPIFRTFLKSLVFYIVIFFNINGDQKVILWFDTNDFNSPDNWSEVFRWWKQTTRLFSNHPGGDNELSAKTIPNFWILK